MDGFLVSQYKMKENVWLNVQLANSNSNSE